ncbi:hypothetical protein Q75_17000 [Bacillus coahuilensis p1.1.43]|uniref:Multidrug ABC transporter permease n=1 Tax=Bacillus coahuilensis p1.1.43 TaxID=1150625 RepID=A0A147K400_9BACI|nr:hypothetical protein [Bacillus coahuilensis]KUP04013.1 hypothetical protein Q75_17000 [Bacillus coahuilensis p1.1.43]
MKLKTSYFNMGIVLQDLKQHGWISLLYFVGLLLTVPILLLMRATDDNFERNYPPTLLDTLFTGDYFLQLFFLFTIPILTGMFIFRYLHKKDSTDFSHSLPIRREGHYFSHLVGGATILLVPIWANTLIGIIIALINSTTVFIPMGEFIIWALCLSFFSLFFFLLSSAVGLGVGNTIAQGVLTYILIGLPMGITLLGSFHLSFFLYGFPEYNPTRYHLFPFYHIGEFLLDSSGIDPVFTVSSWMTYSILMILFFVVGLLFYRYRSLEMTNQIISFKFLRPIFKYGVTLCAMLVGGIYFHVSQDSAGWLYFGYVIGALIGYVMAQMLLDKTWRLSLKKLVIGYGAYAVVVFLIGLSLHFDIYGYETRIPSENEIDEVYVEVPEYGNQVYYYDSYEERYTFSSDRNLISNTALVHEIVAQNPYKTYSRQWNEELRTVNFQYKLENGSTFSRAYTVDMSDEKIKNALRLLVETPEFKKDRYGFDSIDKETDKITLHSEWLYDKTITILNPEEVKQFKALLKQDILEMTFDQEEKIYQASNYRAELSQKNDRYHPFLDYHILDSYVHVNEWLREKGYLEELEVTADDFERMELVEFTAELRNTLPYPEIVFQPGELEMQGIEQDITILEYTDKKEIQQVLDLNSKDYYDYQEDILYIGLLSDSNGNQTYLFFTEDNIPPFLQ